MVNVDIETSLYDKVKKMVSEDKIRYPSIKFFVQKAVMEKLEQ